MLDNSKQDKIDKNTDSQYRFNNGGIKIARDKTFFPSFFFFNFSYTRAKLATMMIQGRTTNIPCEPISTTCIAGTIQLISNIQCSLSN